MRETEEPQEHDDDRRRDRHEERQPARMLGAEPVQRADERDGYRRERLRVRHSEVLKRRKRTERRGDDVIRDEQECPDDRNDLRAVPHARVHAAAVGVMVADDDVVDRHQRGQHAHRRDQPERAVRAERERQADDVRLARAPIAVKNGRRALGIEVARPLVSIPASIGAPSVPRDEKTFQSTGEGGPMTGRGGFQGNGKRRTLRRRRAFCKSLSK